MAATKTIFFVVLSVCVIMAASEPVPQQRKANPDVLEAAFKIPEGIFGSIVGLSKVIRAQQDGAGASATSGAAPQPQPLPVPVPTLPTRGPRP